MTTAFVTDSRFAAHTLEGHPEHAGRLTAIQKALQEAQLTRHFLMVDATPVTETQMQAVHTPVYLEQLAATAQQPGVMFGLDTYVLPESYAIARLAAGGLLRVVDAVMTEAAHNGLAAIRPPGHHATPDMGMGFCLLNNIAIAARCAQQTYDLRQVMIVDFDVHHGNGTQDVFYADPSVLYVSTHQFPLYPGTGSVQETGTGAGQGYTLNIPLPPGVGDGGYKQVFDEIVDPVARRYKPQLLLVSVGFDAHWADPLANMHLSLTGYDSLVRKLIELANEVCDGRIVFVLEGGYNLQVLSHGWANIARALLGQSEVADPLGAAQVRERSVDNIIRVIKQLHKLE
jgi:acetoin utilization deacetylase AcuC-like enzyme